MGAVLPPLAVAEGWVTASPAPVAAGWAGPAVSRPFAVDAMQGQRCSVRFPWMALAAVSGSLGGAVAGIVAVLRLAGIGS